MLQHKVTIRTQITTSNQMQTKQTLKTSLFESILLWTFKRLFTQMYVIFRTETEVCITVHSRISIPCNRWLNHCFVLLTKFSPKLQIKISHHDHFGVCNAIRIFPDPNNTKEIGATMPDLNITDFFYLGYKTKFKCLVWYFWGSTS